MLLILKLSFWQDGSLVSIFEFTLSLILKLVLFSSLICTRLLNIPAYQKRSIRAQELRRLHIDDFLRTRMPLKYPSDKES